MPRQARLDYPGALHHVMGRGIEKKFIFNDDLLKSKFHERVSNNLRRFSIQCYAWCIMGNHFHLLLQTGQTPLAELMSSLLTGYAVYYNIIHKRSGHLFQNRYKSVLCDRNEYLLPLVRYIHLNPVKAGVINLQDLEQYRWTGHLEICRNEKGLIKDKDEILGFFGKNNREGLRGYKEFVTSGLDTKEDYEGGGLVRSAGGLKEVLRRKKDEKEMYDDRILGGGNFVEEVLKKTGTLDQQECKINSIKELLGHVSRYYNVPCQTILETREHCAREARDIFLYMGRKYLGESVTNLGQALHLNQSAASLAIKRARKLDLLNKIENDILESIYQ
ncbi:MAG: transposase [Chlamydiae bacterium]|nr:transposase [Chlamydiota bacterium]MBI3276711.1 transposase [Chlamydiota bacterium]